MATNLRDTVTILGQEMAGLDHLIDLYASFENLTIVGASSDLHTVMQNAHTMFPSRVLADLKKKIANAIGELIDERLGRAEEILKEGNYWRMPNPLL